VDFEMTITTTERVIVGAKDQRETDAIARGIANLRRKTITSPYDNVRVEAKVFDHKVQNE
jgi:hypothetical protein